jgi:hypothetical protein
MVAGSTKHGRDLALQSPAPAAGSFCFAFGALACIHAGRHASMTRTVASAWPDGTALRHNRSGPRPGDAGHGDDWPRPQPRRCSSGQRHASPVMSALAPLAAWAAPGHPEAGPAPVAT